VSNELAFYGELLGEIKNRIRQAQVKAVLSVNAEMILLYWDVGRMIHARQQQEGWGTGVIPRLSRDIRNELPELKGFSERNIGYMIRFAREYDASVILQQLAAKLPVPTNDTKNLVQTGVPTIVQELLARIPWGHNVLLMEKIKKLPTRLWYARQVIDQGWSRDTLADMIKGQAHARQGTAVTNFARRLPASQSELAEQLLKDPYLFDFLTIEEPFHERELETGLVRHLEKFLLELDQGFAFVGRQYSLSVGEDDFYIDLLFYHLKLRCFIVIELKRGKFKPEYAGKMNFYCSVVDDKLRHETDQPTIGLILCQTKDRFIAEYALRDIHKPIGVADYEFTRALPDSLKSSLPSIEEIETELQSELANKPVVTRGRR
jgi:predicted nuclease of restriction endonuclease-like (RecB) superfamily